VAAFGEELRRAREERGLAIEAISEATKVPVRHIRALEVGEYGELPGGVFRRGFVQLPRRVGFGGRGLDAALRAELSRERATGGDSGGVGKICGKRKKQPGCATPEERDQASRGWAYTGRVGFGRMVWLAAGDASGDASFGTNFEGFKVFC